ncbi:uncharacterized protein BDZ99DRAFT_522363 [Mytilinidion resinicola]|uniref:COP9 signalosome complex subunit 12 n=1 Tax=Mytilinidion resinicola TaxID=574789 RepID=A0A6A6YGT1_9PEZI|nr:uncharacterized protein BDZ99DRAFT_522363 [Mytilinidion resinicola]KAF2807743.1 hypothetical protein BDZ99DRAFT_522363 [Mytilinidion resinicola]
MQSSQTPVLDKFLGEVDRIVRDKNGVELQAFLVIEPPFNSLYEAMIAEMRKIYPKGKEGALEQRCSRMLKEAGEDAEGATWTIFVKFMANYLSFIRDVDPSNLLETYNILSELQQKANSALTSPSKGLIILPTVIAYARVFARLAIGLDKNPELIAHLVVQSNSEEDGRRETLPERAANILRTAFVTCLNDRGSGSGGVKDGKPDGKKVGIYKIANLCLKILFQCDKKMNAEQIFTNIYNQSPPLSIYPASERVTYLYYLGRFHFSTGHFFPAQMALQAAYDQCLASPACVGQRRLILIYLVAANMILGRFPTQSLYDRPEAAGLQAIFQPIVHTLIKGDLETFRRLVDWDSPNAPWLMRRYKMLLQIARLCEVIVWRSLFRRAFVLTGVQGDNETRKAPTLDLNYVLALFVFLEKRALHPPERLDKFGPAPDPPPEAYYIDPEFVGADGKPLEGYHANVSLPSMLNIESKCSSLISQGFMNGFISHKLKRFAIKGAKEKGSALAAGWPKFWDVINAEAPPDCPGWKQDVASSSAGGAFGPGMVVNLSNARPVGSGPLG